MYISDQTKWKRRFDLKKENIESIWVDNFPLKSKSWVLCAIYCETQDPYFIETY